MKNLTLSDLGLLATWKRETLLDLLAENDRNGIFTDRQSEAEGMEVMTKAEALEIIERILTENE